MRISGKNSLQPQPNHFEWNRSERKIMDAKPTIRFTRASDVNNERLDSLILEVDINEKPFSALWFIDNTWKIIVSVDGENVTLDWVDFLQIINELHKHVAIESEVMIHELKNPEDEEPD